MIEFDPAHFINRELSWLEFNQRVLDEALDPTNRLFERVKFFCIASSNLDEFYEVRVAGLKQQIESEVVERTIDGLTATETFRAVTRRVRRMVELQYRCWREQLLPALAEQGIRFLRCRELPPPDLAWIENYYRAKVHPVLTPLAEDPAHPFPQVLNKSLNLFVDLQITQSGTPQQRMAIVEVPRVFPRVVKLPRDDAGQDHVFLDDLIGHFLGNLFPGTRILSFWRFRVTRNSELYIDEEEVGNLLKAVENELHNRRRGEAVRLEVQHDCPPEIRARLLENLGLKEDDLQVIDGPLNPTPILAIGESDHRPELRDPPFVAPVDAALREQTDLFAAIRERDVLLHHPYDNFSSVVEFLERAADDSQVLAIKQTLYRTGGDPQVIGALMNAVKNGKQVTAVVEVRARFDEKNNIEWARRLEEAGVHVLYGLVGYKIHSKICLVVRREETGIRLYVHLSTGNYNPVTARIYTDVGLLTCRADFGEDATNLFNLLTGVCQFQGMRKFLVAPFEFHERTLALIQREELNARKGLPARITAKMNSLVDEQVIKALYRASQAGVKIDLIVRGICCLRPKVTGVSENITVRSIVDRFLEHSRIFYFEHGGQPEVYLGSADWMPRNFFGRIELVWPVEDGNLRERLISELLAISLDDNQKARLLQPDGSYRLGVTKRGAAPRRSQSEFISLATGEVNGAKHSRKRNAKFLRVKLAARPFRVRQKLKV